jgi:uncharacterized RDD family membrane protein YckC
MDQRPEWSTETERSATPPPRAAPIEGERPLPLHQGRRLASWGSRVVAYLLDALIGVLLNAPGGVLVGVGSVTHGAVRAWLLTIGSVLLAVGTIIQIWQTAWRQGARGQSWGKIPIGLRTVDVDTLRPIGGPRGMLRWLVDLVLGAISILQLLNYLWPLWDQRHQTWADKVARSVVLAR